MKISDPLDRILDNRAKTKILRFLCTTGAQWNGRQIAREVGITPATAHKALRSLEREGVLLLRNEGKTHVYRLNENHFVVADILKPIFSKEEGVLGDIIRTIKAGISSSSIKKDIMSVALFGSVKNRRDHPMSDIDLFIIVAHSKAKTAAQRLFEEMDRRIAKKFGNALSPYINTKKEVKKKYREGMEVIKNIVKSHTIIYGEKIGKFL